MFLAKLSFWAFVDERLAMLSRKRRKEDVLTSDTILQCGVFANIFGEDDPDTQRAARLSASLGDVRQQVMFDVFFRYSGSHVDSLTQCVHAGGPATWSRTLQQRHSKGCGIIRTDAYHNMWGTGIGRGVRFFTDGYCASLAAHVWEKLRSWRSLGQRRTMVQLVDAMEAWFATRDAGPYRGMHMPFAALTTAFDIASRMPDVIDPDSLCCLGIGARKGLGPLAHLGRTHADRLRALLDQSTAAQTEFSPDAAAAARGRTVNTAAIERALCEYAKYHAYAAGTKKSFYHNRPAVSNTNGYRNADGSLKSPAALQRSLRIHRANGKLGGGARRTAARKLRERQSRGGRRSGFRAAFGVLKSEAAIANIRRLKSKAGSASGPCKQRLCAKCGAGNRAAAHVGTGRGCHKFVLS